MSGPSPKGVPKDWMKVTSSGVTVEANSHREKVVEALRRESRRSLAVGKGLGGRARGASLHMTKIPKNSNGGGGFGGSAIDLGVQGSGSASKLPQV